MTQLALWPEATDIAGLLRQYAQSDATVASRPAFSFYRGNERSVQLSYRQLVAEVEHNACALAQRHGVKRGDRVAVLMPNGETTPAVMLAIMALGAIVVPLNPGFEAADWLYAAQDCAAVGAVVSAPLRDKAEGLARALPFLCSDRDLAAHEVTLAAPFEQRLEHEPAVILYTSGTTGSPKGVVLSHANLLANGRAMARHFRLEASAQLAVMPLFHAHALGFGLMSALVSGGHLVLTNGLNAFHWASIIRAERVVATSVVPPLLPFLIKVRVHAEQVPSLRALLVSSAPLPKAWAREFLDRTGIPLVQGWGLSEFTNFATCAGVDGLEQSRRQLTSHLWPSIGRALDGVEVEVRAADGEHVDLGVKGELFVRGASRMLGYWRGGHPLATPGEWLATGDEGYYDIDECGPLYFITGRIKDIIIRDAEKLSPLAIERHLLDSVPELQGKLAVVGFQHAVHGEEIGAYVESDDAIGTLGEQLVRRAQSLGNALRPKIILWGTQPIPRTHTGKVQRARLRELFATYDTYSGPTLIERAYASEQRPARCLN